VRTSRVYVRLRYGPEYSGDWIVSSPRNLAGVVYELHDACLARGPMDAVNKMCEAGFRPVPDVPVAPNVSDFYSDRWEIMMCRDEPDVPRCPPSRVSRAPPPCGDVVTL